jgi:hypothetical protein
MPADHADDNWPVVAADLRDTLARSGVSETVAARLFAAVTLAAAAIERERGGVEHDLLFALIAVQADIYRRRASS